ncbi:NAC domain-containing protein 79 [Dichanthelium oligosanthes]|uniref:NAC domain-containing protein 79 n=1 Tax=Dichanthelium oligosanthes TaxID=888268 RepID=A0A1E5UYL6_9POAL|nr:NAC domain-containing protein 79 [Dichanthelium oligosanthes]
MGGDDGRLRAPAGPLPPGFRFRPTDEELLTHYLAPKAADAGFTAPGAVREVDIYRAEPWDLLPAGGGGGGGEDGGGYFFCRRSVKFPSGLRTNRATRAGYWKSTGKDKAVLRQQQHGRGGGDPAGVKKTLVFYRGRAPTGDRTNWVMHEYRLAQGHGYTTSPVLATGAQSEWVICRMFMKKPPGETSSQLEQEAVLHPPLGDHLQPSVDGCHRDGGGKTPAPAAAASDSDHTSCFSDTALAMAQGGNGIEGMLPLNHEELLMTNCSSVADFALASSPKATQLRDELAADSFDFLPQLLDYEAFPFILQDF